MSFRIEYGDSIIKPLFSYQFPSAPIQAFASRLSSIVYNDEIYFIAIDDDNALYVIKEDSLIYKSSDHFSLRKPAVTIFNNVLYIFCPRIGELNYWMTDGSISNSGQLILPPILTNCVINTRVNKEKEFWYGSWNGNIYKYSLGSLPNNPPELKDSIIVGEYNITNLAVHEDFYAITYTPKIPPAGLTFYSSSSGNLSINNEVALDLALTKDQDGNMIALLLTHTTPSAHLGKLYVIQDGNILNVLEYSGTRFPLTFSLSDLKRDGNIYVITSRKSIIKALNFSGTSADNFPFEINSEYYDATTPISADIEGDNKPELIFVTHEGDIYAVDGGTGKLIPGFPISFGPASIPSVFNLNGKVNLVAANTDGLLQAWSISSVEGDIIWKEQFADNENTSFIPPAENANRINEFFPTDRAYNYPNPVYEGSTNIRYYVSEDSKINIKIFDLAGDFVAELNDDATGGMDNETVWNVGDIQSGVYLTRIEAVSTSGNSEYAIIKIAVVK